MPGSYTAPMPHTQRVAEIVEGKLIAISTGTDIVGR
jgi:hypothetical protein